MMPTVAESYRSCEQIAFSHYENFPVASVFLPRDKRKHVAAIYAFARIADDYADEPGLKPDERLAKLNDWRNRLAECYAGNATHPVFVALGETARTYSIPQELFDRLLKAFVSDVSTSRYQTFDDVLAYCRNSANPVGRLVLILFGYTDERLALLSDNICTALQLTNFWQDLSIDIRKDRIYIPLEDLSTFGVSVDDLLVGRLSDSFKRLMEFEVDRTQALFEQGRQLLGGVGKDLSFQLKLTWLGGTAILEKIRKMDYDVLNQRPVLSLTDKLLLPARVWIRSI